MRRVRGGSGLASELGFDADVRRRGAVGRRARRRFDGQARFHPAQVPGRRWPRRSPSAAGSIYEHSEPRSSATTAARRQGERPHRSRCDDVVLATHNPLVGMAGIVGATLFQTKLALYTSYVVARPRRRRARCPTRCSGTRRSVPLSARRAASRPRLRDLRRRGSQDRPGDDTDELLRAARARAAATASPAVEVTHRWSGQVIETHDGLPYIGETADHQFAATGFSGNGMTFGTLAAMIARCDRWPAESLGRSVRARTGARSAACGTTSRRTRTIPTTWCAIASPARGRSLRVVKRGSGKILELDGRRWPRIERLTGRSRCGQPTAPIWAAWSRGTRRSAPGIALPRLAIHTRGDVIAGPRSRRWRKSSKRRGRSWRGFVRTILNRALVFCRGIGPRI